MDRRHVPSIDPRQDHAGTRVYAASEVGPREENQDFVGYFRLDRPERQLLVVADGMGGHSGGFEASRLAVEAFEATFADGDALGPAALLRRAVAQANHAVIAEGVRTGREGMGTTVVAALVEDGRAWVAHVGDSRCYLVRDGVAVLLTLDHSRVNRMVQVGMIAPEDAANHPMGHILERSIGGAPEIQPDVAEGLPLARGDRLLLCSDGLWSVVDDPTIARLVADDAPAEAVRAALREAAARGTDDNATVAVLAVHEGPPADAVPRPTDARAALGFPLSAAPVHAPTLRPPEAPPPVARSSPVPTGVDPRWRHAALALGALWLVTAAALAWTLGASEPPAQSTRPFPTASARPDGEHAVTRTEDASPTPTP
jgi:serine/threonine protein phosphatase PrpC